MTFFSYILGLLLISSNFAFADNLCASDLYYKGECYENLKTIKNIIKVEDKIKELNEGAQDYLDEYQSRKKTNEGNRLANIEKRRVLAERSRLLSLKQNIKDGMMDMKEIDEALGLGKALGFKAGSGPGDRGNDVQSAETFEKAVAEFKDKSKLCTKALNDNYKNANDCCVEGEATNCKVGGLLNSALAITGGLFGGGSGALACEQLTNEYARKVTSLENIKKKCDLAHKRILTQCKDLNLKKENLLKADKTDKQEKEAKDLIAHFNSETTPDITAGSVEKTADGWSTAFTKIEDQLKEAKKNKTTLASNTQTCVNGLSTAATIKKMIDARKGKTAFLPTNPIGPKPGFPIAIPVIGDNNNELTGGLTTATSLYGDEPDSEFRPDATGTDHKDGDSAGQNNNGNNPGYASPAGLSGGFGSNAGGGKAAGPASSSGSSSLLRGFSSKSYSGRVGVRSGKYSSSGKRYVGTSQRKKSRRKGRAFNLRAFLPGGKNDPNRRLASVGGAGVDIFAVMSRKFKSSCVAKKLLDCK